MDSISSSTAAPSILIVEDDAPSREAVTHAPTQAGYEVIPASSGEDALDLIAAAEFDGLLCAIELPGRADGWEVGAGFSFILAGPSGDLCLSDRRAAAETRKSDRRPD